MTVPDTTPTPFDLTGPLPTGTTLLEASAGTGKTFTLGALVTRYVAEGVARLDEMLVITFGRAATQEMRERVRSALVQAERALADPDVADTDNAVLAHLLAADEPERAVRGRRLRDALASFDAATIATTHQFCQLVLRSLGVAGDSDATATLVDSLDELVVEVADDLYLQWYGDSRGTPHFDRTEALAVARAAVGDPQATLAEADEGSASGRARTDFAQAVRREVERRKRRRGILYYDDLLSRLARALDDPDAPARARMRDRWRIVLVDEFQDTDPVQWQVLDRAFSGHATMVLIGDPKQAIYAFRGGDVTTYLAAARTATTHATLGTNHRTDGALLDRLQVVLRGAALGDAEIVVREVAARHRGSRLRGAPQDAPFRLRQLRTDGFRTTKYGLNAGQAREHIARDCAADIAALLASEATWDDRRVRAGDIAVLVAERNHGLLVQRALAEHSVPAVLPGGDLFATPAADEWLALLTALESPHRSGLVRAAALTHFFGATAEQLDTEGEDLTARVADTLRGWSLLLRGRGVAALVEAAEERGLGRRVLGETDGERLLTDLRHVGHLLHEVVVRDGLGLTSLREWFQAERARKAEAGERSRRLDSDAAAVQIVTIHGSKGLEYPICYLPFAYQYYLRPPDAALFHDDAGQRTLDVSGSGRSWEGNVERHNAEDLGEELRELYVALTRAQSQVVTWWAPTYNTPHGALHRLLFGRLPGTADVPDRQDTSDDDRVAEILGRIEALGGPVAETSVIVPAEAPAPAPEEGRPAVRTFTRTVDHAWRRTSYSGLIRVEEEQPPGVASEPEQPTRDDEEVAADGGFEARELAPQPASDTVVEERGALATSLETTASTPDAPLSPMADLPAGATFGSLVHAVLEHTDPDAPDLREELLTHVREQQRWWYVPAEPEAIAEALLPLHHTSLGPLAGGRTLAEVPLRDRLCELDFEFPLAGGDLADRRAQRRDEVRLRDLAPLLREHLPSGDPLAPYADRLEQPALGDQPLRGYLSGSVDVVLRLGERFVVVDYKTNRLGAPDAEPDRPSTAADYAADRLAEAMLHSHYPLQAMLYSVVAHRYLRWRLPGYHPETHLGGVLYLYLRGMCGPETPETDGHPAGVFSWQPPADLVVAMSDLLAAEGGGS